MHPLPHKAISAGPPGAGGQSFCLPVVILSTPLTGYPILAFVKYHIEYTSACRLPFWLFFLSGVVLVILPVFWCTCCLSSYGRLESGWGFVALGAPCSGVWRNWSCGVLVKRVLYGFGGNLGPQKRQEVRREFIRSKGEGDD